MKYGNRCREQQLKHIILDPRAIKAIAIKYNLKKFAFWRIEWQVVRYYYNHYIPQSGCFLQMLLLFVYAFVKGL